MAPATMFRCLCSLTAALLLASEALLMVEAETIDPRRTVKRFLDCTIESKTLADCNLMGYVYRLAPWLLPGLITGILMLLCLPTYCLGKYACNCCGGRRQTPNFCCPATKFPARYSKGDILRPRIFTVMVVMVCLGAGGWGLVFGAWPTLSGLSGLMDAVSKVPNILKVTSDDLASSFTIQQYSATTKTETSKNLLAGANLAKSMDDVNAAMTSATASLVGYVEQVTGYLGIAFYVLFVAPAGLALFALIFAVCNIRQCGPMLVLWLTFLLAIILWIVQAIFGLLSVGFGDVCYEMMGMAEGKNNVLLAVAPCAESTFTKLMDQYAGVRSDQITTTCNGIKDACYDSSLTEYVSINKNKVFACPAAMLTDPTYCTTLSMNDLVNNWGSFKIHSNIEQFYDAGTLGAMCITAGNRGGCTMEKCLSDCLTTSGRQRSNITEISKQLYYDYIATRRINVAVQVAKTKYASCSSLFGLLMSSLAKPCVTMADGSIVVRQAGALLGGAMIALLFACGWGAKRFIPMSMADVPLPPADDPEEEPAPPPTLTPEVEARDAADVGY